VAPAPMFTVFPCWLKDSSVVELSVSYVSIVGFIGISMDKSFLISFYLFIYPILQKNLGLDMTSLFFSKSIYLNYQALYKRIFLILGNFKANT
jgi:hypothetical protein